MWASDTMGGICYVYFIRAGEFIKIGRANDPYERMYQLQTGNPIKLELLEIRGYPDRQSALEAEKTLHDYFEGVRTEGEWFIGQYVERYLWDYREISNQKMARRIHMSKDEKREWVDSLSRPTRWEYDQAKALSRLDEREVNA